MHSHRYNCLCIHLSNFQNNCHNTYSDNRIDNQYHIDNYNREYMFPNSHLYKLLYNYYHIDRCTLLSKNLYNRHNSHQNILRHIHHYMKWWVHCLLSFLPREKWR